MPMAGTISPMPRVSSNIPTNIKTSNTPAPRRSAGVRIARIFPAKVTRAAPACMFALPSERRLRSQSSRPCLPPLQEARSDVIHQTKKLARFLAGSAPCRRNSVDEKCDQNAHYTPSESAHCGFLDGLPWLANHWELRPLQDRNYG